MKNYFKTHWKFLLLDVFIISFYTTTPLYKKINLIEYYSVVGLLAAMLVFKRIDDYLDAMSKKLLDLYYIERDARCIDVIERLAQELIYPELSVEGRKSIIKNVKSFIKSIKQTQK